MISYTETAVKLFLALSLVQLGKKKKDANITLDNNETSTYKTDVGLPGTEIGDWLQSSMRELLRVLDISWL